MKSIIEKDKQKRKNFAKKEIKNIALKHLYFNEYLNKNVRLLAKSMLHKTSNLESRVSVRNSCVLSGRKNSVYRKYKLSRIKLKKLILKGEIPGFVKTN